MLHDGAADDESAESRSTSMEAVAADGSNDLAALGGVVRPARARGDHFKQVNDTLLLRLTNLDRVLRPFPTVEDAIDAW